jgi:hypothetical protein
MGKPLLPSQPPIKKNIPKANKNKTSPSKKQASKGKEIEGILKRKKTCY